MKVAFLGLIFCDGKKVIDAHDDALEDAGKFGVWTKADSIVHFDDLTATPSRTPQVTGAGRAHGGEVMSHTGLGIEFCLALLFALPQAFAQQKAAPDGQWKPVQEIFGFAGDPLAEGAIRFNMPRKDLHVTLGGIEIKPGLALGSWAAFHRVGKNDAMIMGDLVLTSDEVAPVVNGHFWAVDDAVKLAKGLSRRPGQDELKEVTRQRKVARRARKIPSKQAA